ncbi:MAG: TPM domain-containing protein [Sinomicrobium sp.]|nr:TPM domain-containing protein [Sinomicrobium sp.]
MNKSDHFLTEKEEQEVVEAIRIAEKNTSGELRVHIERTTDLPAFERAAQVFRLLKMDTTELRNGVLIYLAVKDRVFAIYGDKGINEAVPAGFWEDTRDIMASHFKKGDFIQGLINGILKAGEQLQQHFPWHTADKNELEDTISKGDDFST